MRKTFSILTHELIVSITRRSFLLFGVLLPIGAMLGLALFARVSAGAAGAAQGEADDEQTTQAEGFVDHSGLVQSLPRDVPAGLLLRFDTEAEAQAALAAGEISSYYLIPADHLESGELTYVRTNYSPMAADRQDRVMRWTLLYNLVGADQEAAQRIWTPMLLQVEDLAALQATDGACTRPGPYCEDNPVLRMLPMFVTVGFFAILMSGAGILMRGVSSEKQNRVMEVLLLSTSARRLLVGKIIGRGLASLLATAAWVVSGYLTLAVGGSVLNIPEGFAIPASVVYWTIVYFILGYAVYASLMAGAGALVPDLKEISAATWVVASPLFLGYFLAIVGIDAPNGPLAVAISLFPLTAPVGMVMRLTIGGVPGWQLALSIGLLALTAALAVQLSARMFRAQDLLSGQSFSPRRYLRALVGR